MKAARGLQGDVAGAFRHGGAQFWASSWQRQTGEKVRMTCLPPILRRFAEHYEHVEALQSDGAEHSFGEMSRCPHRNILPNDFAAVLRWQSRDAWMVKIVVVDEPPANGETVRGRDAGAAKRVETTYGIGVDDQTVPERHVSLQGRDAIRKWWK